MFLNSYHSAMESDEQSLIVSDPHATPRLDRFPHSQSLQGGTDIEMAKKSEPSDTQPNRADKESPTYQLTTTTTVRPTNNIETEPPQEHNKNCSH